jgi:Protein of unknown function, DUF488
LSGTEVRVEVCPHWPFRLPRRAGLDGLTRIRSGVLHRLLHARADPVPVPVLVFYERFGFDPLIGSSERANPGLRVAAQLNSPNPPTDLSFGNSSTTVVLDFPNSRVRTASHPPRAGAPSRAIVRHVRRVVTIGVYEWDLDHFLAALRAADVRLLLDVRQRRGVRGREYAWANANRLQRALALAGVDYQHHLELAPTTELRQLQYAQDAREGVGKRSRRELAAEYRDRYTAEILDRADLGAVARELPKDGAAALFCVERDPQACHRSIIANRVEAEYGVGVGHLLP